MYSEQERLAIIAISSLRLFPSPIVSESDNRIWTGSLQFVSPIEGIGNQSIKSLRLLDFQLEDLVTNLGCSSDEQLSRIFNVALFGQSEANVIIHKRKVGATYVNPKTNKEFTVNPSENYEVGDVVYSVELDTTEPIILSDEARDYLRQISIAADIEIQKSRINKSSSAFEERKAARLALVAKRRANVNNNDTGNGNGNNVNEQLQQELDTLNAIQRPNAKEKARIAEIEALLVVE